MKASNVIMQIFGWIISLKRDKDTYKCLSSRCTFYLWIYNFGDVIWFLKTLFKHARWFLLQTPPTNTHAFTHTHTNTLWLSWSLTDSHHHQSGFLENIKLTCDLVPFKRNVCIRSYTYAHTCAWNKFSLLFNTGVAAPPFQYNCFYIVLLMLDFKGFIKTP